MKRTASIALDGPAASGKSTIAERVAEQLDFLYFDTGVMYRAVTLAVLRLDLDPMDENAVTNLAQAIHIEVRPPNVDDGRQYDVLLDGEDVTWDIRTDMVNRNVSQVSTYRGVRKAMTSQQRQVAKNANVIMVGRDIGTVVLPEADLKIYLDATVNERARRRYLEEKQRGRDVELEKLVADMARRDRIDSTRAIAPLKPAPDAVIIDTTGKTIEEVTSAVINEISTRLTL